MEENRSREETRERILAAAHRLIAESGRESLTTRAISAEAGVQAPTIYRLFGDKGGLLDAVAEHGFRAYLATKSDRSQSPDPVEELRAGWDVHVGFGLANPVAYSLVYGDARPGAKSSAAEAGFRILRDLIHRIALAGRLTMTEERAAQLVHAAACGTVLTLLALPTELRDLALSTTAREAILAAISTDTPVAPQRGVAAAAIALRAALPESKALTEGERIVLGEWLDRLSA
ncbi:TetR/AcrR family transcriptional regulator [bacterium]|nr:MAG: TetR/AcrR family transcriptional regulator [bacterium]